MATRLLRLPEALAGELDASADLLLDAQNLVVLGQTLRAAGSTGLDLSGGQADDQIADERVLGLAGTVRDHGAPAVLLGQQMGGNGLGDGTDLVNLQQQAVAGLLLHSGGNALGVGHGQIVTHNLDGGGTGQVGPGLPVVLVEGILNGDNGEVLDELLVHVGQLVGRQPLGLVALGVLEVQIVLAIPVELRGSHIHADLDLAGVASLGDGVADQAQGLLVRLNVGGEATLIAHSGGIQTELGLDNVLQMMVHLGAHLHGLGKAGGTGGQDHELLHGQLVAGVAAAVDHVEGGHGQDDLLVASQIGDVFVQWHVLLGGTGLADGQGHTQDGVGAELALVLGAVQLQHEVIDGSLVHHIQIGLDQLGAQGVVDMTHSLQHGLAMVVGLVVVAQLQSFVDTGGGAGGHGSAEQSQFGGQIDLHGGVSTGVVDLTGLNRFDGHIVAVTARNKSPTTAN